MKNTSTVTILIWFAVGLAILMGGALLGRFMFSGGLHLEDVILEDDEDGLASLASDPSFGISIAMPTGSPDALLGYLGCMVIIDESIPAGDPGHLQLDGRFRPRRDQIRVTPLNEVLFEGKLSAGAGAGGEIAAFVGKIGAKEIAEIIVRNDLVISHSDSSEIPFDDIRRYPMQPTKRYLFIDSIVVTTSTRRTYREARSSTGIRGSAFVADGKVYASDERFSSTKQIWIPPFNPRLSRSAEGAGQTELARLLRLEHRSASERDRLISLIHKHTHESLSTKFQSVRLPPPPTANDRDPGERIGVLGTPVRVDGVPRLKQASPQACWATAAAMLVGWREGKPITPEQLIGSYTPRWRTILEEDTGLDQSDKSAFLFDAGLSFEWGASYMPRAVADMLRTHGPLWFTIGSKTSFSTHALIVIGIFEADNDIWVSFIDPRDGQEHDLRYADFHRAYDEGGYLSNELYHGDEETIYTIHVVHCGDRTPLHDLILDRRQLP